MVRAAAAVLLVSGAAVLISSAVPGTPVLVPVFGLLVFVAGVAGMTLDLE